MNRIVHRAMLLLRQEQSEVNNNPLPQLVRIRHPKWVLGIYATASRSKYGNPLDLSQMVSGHMSGLMN